MAKPRIFISSTFYDLRHIRSSLENFVENLGYDSILSEKGVIAYTNDIALDESCYREAALCDIFVLIIGGRYGSPTSLEKKDVKRDFYARYESITKSEYETASKKDIPIYILIEKSVFSEFDTFKNNKENTDIKYAHVDSINIFYFIEQILSQPRNNPIQTFEKHQEIEVWLKEQWAGLFRELINKKSNDQQLISLTTQVSELAEINTTLKRYLEEVVSKVSTKDAGRIIKEEKSRLEKSKKFIELEQNPIYKQLKIYNISDDDILKLYENAKSLDDFASSIEKNEKTRYITGSLLPVWRENPDIVEKINKGRMVLGLEPLGFKE